MARRNEATLGGYTKRHRGKHRTVTVRADAIRHDLDPKAAGQTVAEAILEVVRERIRGISQAPSQATLERRRAAGRSGTKAFNDTGKLVRELELGAEGDQWRTESPSRLTGGQSYLLERLGKLVDLSPRSILGDRRVKEAIKRTHARMVKVEKRRR